MILPPPNELGLPEKYVRWRKNQSEAAEEIIACQKPYITQIAPTGFGKSLSYTTAAHIATNRTIILTATKALQSQLMNDFSETGMVTVKGKNAYMCKVENDGSSCDDGPCNAGFKCNYRDGGGCPYYDAIKRAQHASLVVTNYAFWMTYNKYARGLEMPDLLVCDEAHNLPQTVSSFLTCKINRTNPLIWSVINPPSYESSINIEEWADWADLQIPRLDSEIASVKKTINAGASKKIRRKLRILSSLRKNLARMTEMDSETWVMDINSHYLEFAPIWPKAYTKDVLFFDIPKVLLTSATVSRKTTEMLGIADEDNTIIEFSHSFPVKSRRLIHIPTVRLNIRSTPLDIREWTRRIDQILRTRLDRKGIIHTTSYDRRNHVMAQSQYQDYMITHQSRDVIKQVNKFKNSEAPRFLVSPSLTTGWDFPDDYCRLQIIGKVPYPDTRNKIVKARCKEDSEYGAYIAAQGLEQAVGRGTRSKTDWCENIIIDNNINWFIKKYKKFMHRWFLEAFSTSKTIPEPPKMKGE